MKTLTPAKTDATAYAIAKVTEHIMSTLMVNGIPPTLASLALGACLAEELARVDNEALPIVKKLLDHHLDLAAYDAEL